MYNVTVLPYALSPHLSQVFAGLYELAATGRIELQFAISPPTACVNVPPHLLRIELAQADGAAPSYVAFDMRDCVALDEIVLGWADVYFKRTCDPDAIARLPISLRGKVQPYGLNYGCTTNTTCQTAALPRQPWTVERAEAELRTTPPRQLLRRGVARALRPLYKGAGKVTASTPLAYADFEAGAESAVKPSVLFLTRVWNPANTSEAQAMTIERLNASRIEIIRTLRDQLGNRFLGGVEPDPYAQQLCPDCVVDYGADKTDYVQLMKTHLIGIASTGLHDSIGWKLAEYIAAARCIVSEPLRWDLGAPLAEGEHYLAFNTPNECAEVCRRLLDDPSAAQAMRRNNEAYYRQELKPPVMVLKHLQTAASFQPVARKSQIRSELTRSNATDLAAAGT